MFDACRRHCAAFYVTPVRHSRRQQTELSKRGGLNRNAREREHRPNGHRIANARPEARWSTRAQQMAFGSLRYACSVRALWLFRYAFTCRNHGTNAIATPTAMVEQTMRAA